jgi:WD40 repeat protein
MTYCLNPACWHPQNSDDDDTCQSCGARLRLANRYRALKVLGQGGFGRTLLAVDEAANQLSYCVIKQFLPQHPTSGQASQAKALFFKEAKRLADLGQHPQIPHFLDYIEDDQGQYLLQEFIQGHDLATLLAEQGPFNEGRIRQVFNDLLPVLQFIHSHQIIHRDIKPENIICPDTNDATDEPRKLVLVDFGASKYASETVLGRTGTIIGSAAYIAPEQAMGKADFASDLYSLGVTCIHLLTALHPFDLYSVSEDAWIWRSYLMEPISKPLAAVLDKLLQRATNQRYRTATEVWQDLNPIRVPMAKTILEPSPQRTAVHRLRDRRSPPSRIAAKRLTRSEEHSWQEVQTLIGHAGAVTTIALSPDQQFLISGSSDRTIKLWELATGTCVHTFTGKRSLWSNAGHTDRIRAVVFHPDGQTVLSGSDDGTIKQWNLNSGELIDTFPDQGWGVTALTSSRDGQLLISGGGDRLISLWDLATATLIETLDKHRDQISALVLEPNGQRLLSASYDKMIRLWNLQTAQPLNTLRGHTDRISAIAVSSDWLTLVSGSWDKTLKIWDLTEGRQVRTLVHHLDRVSCLAMSPNDRWLASGGEDNTIKLWALEDSDRLKLPQTSRPLLVGHAWGINALCFTADSQCLISGSTDETIRIWRRVKDHRLN